MIREKLETWRLWVEDVLEASLPEDETSEQRRITEAMRYSLMAGGKRIRPVLVYAADEAIRLGSLKEGTDYQAIPTRASLDRLAAAIEMVHTYSLIHDDLPCMDNDELRRGRPTNHVVYGEGVAVLAGDALLNRAFELLFEMAAAEGSRGVEAGLTVSRLFGRDGMIGGQMIDIENMGKTLSVDDLRLLQKLKTGALLRSPLTGTARLYGLRPELADIIDTYGDLMGQAFQIQDDLLDVTSDTATMGKTVGKDERDDKITYVTLLGKSGAEEKLEEVTQSLFKTCEQLKELGFHTAFLHDLIVYLNTRKN